MNRLNRVRRGFTLVELLVAMAVIVVLTGLALVVVPGILDQDRTTDGASLTRQFLMISKNRAGRDGLPRGLRLIVGLDQNNPAKTNPLFVTELQYTESPPVLVSNPNMLARVDYTSYPPPPRLLDPHVAMFYTTNSATGGNLVSQRCELRNLSFDDAVQVIQYSIIALPTLGTWHRVMNVPAPVQQTATQYGKLDPTRYVVPVVLDVYPDAQLGAASSAPVPSRSPQTPSWTTFHFGLYGAPRPLLGEPLLQLPKNICIDLSFGVSRPAGTVGVDYDIVFAPSGQVIPTTGALRGEGQVNLWVRDYTKLADMTPTTPTPLNPTLPYTYALGLQQFRQGGEMQIVALKTRTGSLGVFPVYNPEANGTYPVVKGVGLDPYFFATQGTNAP
jgi:prepilin-type N-terminal cleavage/methylation domain-containing protein